MFKSINCNKYPFFLNLNFIKCLTTNILFFISNLYMLKIQVLNKHKDFPYHNNVKKKVNISILKKVIRA